MNGPKTFLYYCFILVTHLWLFLGAETPTSAYQVQATVVVFLLFFALFPLIIAFHSDLWIKSNFESCGVQSWVRLHSIFTFSCCCFFCYCCYNSIFFFPFLIFLLINLNDSYYGCISALTILSAPCLSCSWFAFLFCPSSLLSLLLPSLPLSCFIFFLLRPFPNRHCSIPHILDFDLLSSHSVYLLQSKVGTFLSYDVNPLLLTSVCDTAWPSLLGLPCILPFISPIVFPHSLLSTLFLIPIPVPLVSPISPPPLSLHSKAVDHREELH